MKKLSFVAVIFSVILSAAPAAAQLPEGNSLPDLAFDSQNNLYGIVYDAIDAAINMDPYVQILNPDGSASSGATKLSTTIGLGAPQIAYDETNQEYLVVWSRQDAGTMLNIYGQLVGRDGVPVGSVITISNAPGDQGFPSVANDTVNQTFLVLWNDVRTGTNHLYGQLVGAAGTLEGAEIPVFTGAALPSEEGAQIAYDKINQRFFVVWDDNRNGGWHVFGQIISADASAIGPSFAVSAPAFSGTRLSDVAYDDVNQRYLAAWDDNSSGNYDIYAQLVGADGATIGNNIAIFTGPNDQFDPSVAFDPVNPRYLVVWDHTTDGINYYIYGQWVNADGALDGSLFQISQGTVENVKPAVVYNSLCANFLVSYTDETSPTALHQIIIGDACETTPPTVAATSPVADATDVAVNAAITATFSEAMRSSTINAGTFTLSGGVQGTVAYDATTMVATFTPSADLTNGTSYTVTVTTGVKDKVGNSMAADYTWSFTTTAIPSEGGGCSLIPRMNHW